jgi:hypothetical protein
MKLNLKRIFKKKKTLEFIINDEIAANYLNITITNIRRRLMNKYSNTNFIENVDYIKCIVDSKEIYMINYKCFEKLELVDVSI